MQAQAERLAAEQAAAAATWQRYTFGVRSLACFDSTLCWSWKHDLLSKEPYKQGVEQLKFLGVCFVRFKSSPRASRRASSAECAAVPCALSATSSAWALPVVVRSVVTLVAGRPRMPSTDLLRSRRQRGPRGPRGPTVQLTTCRT